jgi:hypothetical protein
LSADTRAGHRLPTDLRYNTEFFAESVRRSDETLSHERIASLSARDDTENMDVLRRLGARLAEREANTEHFPPGFDLPPG